MRPADDLLIRSLRQPELAPQFSLAQWDLLVRQARQAGLLARLHARLHARDLADAIPSPVRWHFDAARTLADKQQIAVRWEVAQIRAALAGVAPLVAMKGAAYVVAGLPAAEGRLFNDIDVLVPRAQLPRAEAALMLAGWRSGGLTPYDERYYRRWMHEIPPMQHVRRGTVIDVHHAILPDTARYFPDPEKLLGRIVPVDAMPGVFVLGPEDRILHAAAHLFHDGELPHGLRDLTDLDLLLAHEAVAPGFWSRLVGRAKELELGRPLFYALRYAHHFLGTGVPEEVWRALRDVAPGRGVQTLMDAVYSRVLSPIHASCDDRWSPLARQAAYVRAHWLRMPSHLLLPHLFHKAFISPYQEPESPKAA